MEKGKIVFENESHVTLSITRAIEALDALVGPEAPELFDCHSTADIRYKSNELMHALGMGRIALAMLKQCKEGTKVEE